MQRRQHHVPSARNGRVLTKTPWEIAVQVAHKEISYGHEIERLQNGHVLPLLKKAIFEAVRRALVENSQ